MINNFKKHPILILVSILAIIGISLVSLLPCLANASTLTVTNALTDRTYTAYQVLNRDTSGVYTINKTSELYLYVKTWATSSEASGAVTFAEDDTKGTFTITDSFTSDIASKFSKYLMDNIDSWSSGTSITKYTQVASGNVVTFAGVLDGYYLVQSSAGNTGSMVTVRGTGSINEKNAAGDLGTVTFDVDGDYLQYGDTVNATHTTVFNETFTTTSSGTFWVVPKIQIYDNTNSHLCFTSPSISSVTLNGTALVKDTDYSVTYDVGYAVVELKPGKSIKIGDALVVNASLEVSKENLECSKDEKKNIVYGCLFTGASNNEVSISEDSFGTLRLDAHKLPDNSKYILKGAKFKIYKNDSTTPIDFEYVPDSSGTFYTLTPKTSETTGTTINEIPAGVMWISGLGSGDYKFEETVAPEGYNKLTDKVTCTLTDQSIKGTYIEVGSENPQWYEGGFSILNHKGIIIPSTGGVGTLALIIIGCLVIGFATIYSIRKKNQNKQKDLIES